MISNITDQILSKLNKWQERSLDEVYTIVFTDAIHFSVRPKNTLLKSCLHCFRSDIK